MIIMEPIETVCVGVMYTGTEASSLYRVLYKDGMYRDLQGEKLKEWIHQGKLVVENIKLGKNNRIYLKEDREDFINP